MVNLGTLPLAVPPYGNRSKASAINNSGQVIGSSGSGFGGDPQCCDHAFLYDPATGMIDLGEVDTSAINNSGQVVRVGASGAFLYTEKTGMIDLGTLPGDDASYASGINDLGQVVGGSFHDDGTTSIHHSFLYSPATGMVNLSTLDAVGAVARAINNSGQILGSITTANGNDDPFLYSSETGMIDLGTLGGNLAVPEHVNDSGEFVGYSYIDSINDTHAFLYSKATGMVNLNSFLPSNSGWVLRDATAINNSGQIVGQAYDPMDDETDAFVLNVSPRVVNVVTHGFNPTPTDPTGFRQPFVDLGKELDQELPKGTDLQGEVNSYVTQWDSSSGWIGAFASVASSLLGVPADLAFQSARLFMVEAAANAEQAAQTAYSDLTDPQSIYLGPPSDGQLIQLIGHSRGAAVNARLSQILHEHGYNVDQYISLDGYSTDWPLPSNILGDISIVGTTNADRKVNYEVVQGLLPAIIGQLEKIVGKPLTTSETKALLDAGTDWRANDRQSGFDNLTIQARARMAIRFPIISILWIFTRTSAIPISRATSTSSSMTPPARWLQRLAMNPAGSSMMTAAAAAPDYSNFHDGSFASLGSFWNDVKAANINAGDSSVVAYWLSMVTDPDQLLSAEWTVSGNAYLVQSDGNTTAELTQSATPTSIGQYLELDSHLPQR